MQTYKILANICM